MRKLIAKIDLKNNRTVVIIEAVFLGVLFATEPYLPVFLTRLGASTFQVGLITAMPAVAGLLLTIPIGQFLMNRRRVTDWYRLPRLAGGLSYVLIGLAPFLFVTPGLSTLSILAIWAAATLPQVVLMITFSIVMNAVSGAEGRYEMMARRMAVVVLCDAACVAGGGWFLEQFPFPLNYQLLFILFGVVGGGTAFYFASLLRLPENTAPRTPTVSLRQTLQGYAAILKSNPAFNSFVWIRFVFMLGLMLASPLFPVYYVRQAHASDAWIGAINTVQLGVMVGGYFFWMRQARRRRGNHAILLWTTLGVTLYPAVTALTTSVEVITLVGGAAAFFQAGLDLVFFDELMSTVPPEESIRYISLAQSIQYVATISGPLLGSFLAGQIGLGGALLVGAAVRGLGFLLFLVRKAPANA